MITNSPTFCPAPWTSLNIDQTGDTRPCLNSHYSIGNIKNNTVQEIISGPKLLGVKNSMAAGEWSECCKLCKESEDTIGVSPRTQRHCDNTTLEAINNDITWFEPQHLVVNWSNLCNLTCVYCNADTSTAWQSVKKIPITFVKNDQQSITELMRTHGHKLQGLLLGGGEPLLQKGLVEMLRLLNPEQVRVLVTTNISIDITTNLVYQELRKWPNVEWQVSFDNANKDKFEYVRDGANWELFVQNIDQMVADGQVVNAHPAYSIYCAFDLIEYYKFCKEHKIGVFWCNLSHPFDLDVRRLPESLRIKAANEIDQVIEWCENNYHDNLPGTGLALDTLSGYRRELIDNSGINRNIDYVPDVPRFHKGKETELKKSVHFADLWPDIVAGINND